MASKFIKADELAAALGIELSTLRKMVQRGDLPQAIEVGKKLRRWRRSDIAGMAYMIANKYRCRPSTDDEIDADESDKKAK